MSLSYKKLYEYASDYCNHIKRKAKKPFRAIVAYNWVAGFIGFVRIREKERSSNA